MVFNKNTTKFAAPQFCLLDSCLQFSMENPPQLVTIVVKKIYNKIKHYLYAIILKFLSRVLSIGVKNSNGKYVTTKIHDHLMMEL